MRPPYQRIAVALVLCLVVLVVVFGVRMVEGANDAVQVHDNGRIVWWYAHDETYCVSDGDEDGYCDPIPLDVIEALCR